MATELWASYKQWADVQEDALLTWLDPSQSYKLSPMQNYPLMDFASAFAICVAYLAFVVVGTLVMKAGVPAIKTSAVQFVYNPLQVVLCSYMCVEAGIQAYRNVSPLFHSNPLLALPDQRADMHHYLSYIPCAFL